MVNLNKDVLFLIFKELQSDKHSLYRCLLVNRTWCEVAVSVLWKVPVRNYITHKSDHRLFYLSKSLIYLYSSDKSRGILKNRGIDVCNQKPLFDYISFWKYLNLHDLLYKIADFMKIMKVEESKIPIIKNEILKQFINGNTRFTHLYVPVGLKEQIHLVPRAGQSWWFQ